MQKQVKTFLVKHKQNADFNQYWYSDKTIMFLAQQAQDHKRCCFMSTPSIFYAIDNQQKQQQLYLFDFDTKFSKNNQNYFQYDFNHPQLIPQKFNNYFDFVLVDPPFITFQVWQKYAQAIRKIIKKNENGQIVGHILLSTIEQNQQFLIGLLGVQKKIFKPSIPHLVYQYCLYSNYNHQQLNQLNKQIPQ